MRQIGLILALFFILTVKGQEKEYNRELVYGFHVSTIGGIIGGLDLKKSWIYDKNDIYSIGISVSEIKHPKEEKWTIINPVTVTEENIKLGKSNNLYVLRSQLSLEHFLFNKYHEDGVRMSVHAGLGLSFGFLKPYQVEFISGIDSVTNAVTTEFEQYDPNKHKILNAGGATIGTIVGKGGFFRGWDNLRLVPGINAKLAMSFEFGKYNHTIKGIEIGFLAEAFTQKMVIIPEAKNRFLFTSGYLGLFYGTRKYKAPKY
ncbi:MAG: hypothetical protein AB8B61_00210 [Cyclobacteriaceae bacterium]